MKGQFVRVPAQRQEESQEGNISPGKGQFVAPRLFPSGKHYAYTPESIASLPAKAEARRPTRPFIMLASSNGARSSSQGLLSRQRSSEAGVINRAPTGDWLSENTSARLARLSNTFSLKAASPGLPRILPAAIPKPGNSQSPQSYVSPPVPGSVPEQRAATGWQTSAAAALARWQPMPQPAPSWYQSEYVAAPLPDTQQQQPGRRRVPIWARVVIAIMIVFLVLAGGGTWYYYTTFGHTVSDAIGQTVPRARGDDAPNQAVSTTGDILSGNRLNILLLGSDTDQKFRGAYLAQTDIIVTIDPKTQSVSMLSIPRDTWLNAPGYGMMKLDQVYSYGGVALCRAIIHADFGIYIDYYAWVGLDGFIKVIDTAGGVDIDAIHPITDDNYPDDIGNHGKDIYAMKRLYIAPGPQHLSGVEALEYVRSRHADLVGDFGRSVRQQQVLTQLKARLSNATIFSKLPELAHDLDGYVKTDMQLADVLRLMTFARSLDANKIHRVTLGPPFSTTAHIENQDVVLLNCSKIIPVIAQMFDLGSKAMCNAQAGDTQTGSTTDYATTHGQQAMQTTASHGWQVAEQVLNAGIMNLRGDVSANSDLLAIHSLLDLLLMIAFESPEAHL